MDYSRYEEKHLKVTIEDRIAVITLNRPEVHNAINYDMHTALENIFREIGVDRNVGAIIITGEGKSFCAGGDVKGFGIPDERPIDQLRGTRYLVQEMINCEAPIISAVNGTAMGLGATVALLADVSYMSDKARIGDTHVKMGLVCGDGGAMIWPMLIGPHKAKEMLMAARLLSGQEAADMNIVNHCVPHDELMDHAMAYAKEVASLPVAAVRWTKMAVNQMLKNQMNLVFDFGVAAEHLSAHTEDMKEAISAFSERREPKFTGR